MKIIGLTGLKGSGKDTAAQALIEEGYERLAFADPLRNMLYTLNPIVKVGSVENRAFGPQSEFTRWQEYLDYHGYDEAKKHPEVRRLMQIYGTEVIRQQFGQDAWVDLAIRTIRSKPETRWVLTDVRFDNEAEAVHAVGGFVARVERDGLTADGHASEGGVSESLIDLIVPNNGTVDELHGRMKGVSTLLGTVRRTR